ncbi:MAG: DMT family transporter [Granulosicoccus sp.]
MQRISPTLLVLLAIVSIQLGAGSATFLFPYIGAEGTVALRILLSAFLLALATRLSVQSLRQTFFQHWRLMVVFGACIAAMNLFFYMAIARIPLAAVVAIEFIGPLSVAVFSSPNIKQLGWVCLAGLGIGLLSPFSGSDLNTPGVVLALMAGAGWAMFIIIAARVGKKVEGNTGLVLGMSVAAIFMIPLVVPAVPELMKHPWLFLACLGVALLSTALPFSFEFEALKRLSKRAYGVLVSIEPAVATVVGAVLLGERMGLQGIAAVGCIVIAAIGITVTTPAD